MSQPWQWQTLLLCTCSLVTCTFWQLAYITEEFQVRDTGKSKCYLHDSAATCVLLQEFAWGLMMILLVVQMLEASILFCSDVLCSI